MFGFTVDADTFISVFASFALVRSKFVARSALSPALWFIWSIDNAVSAVCFLQSNDWTDGGFNFCAEAIATFVVMFLAVRYGQVRFSNADRGDLTSCLVGACCWGIATMLGFTLAGELSLLALGLLGTIAFFRSLSRDPLGESLAVWMLFLLADSAALISFSGESLTGYGFLSLELATSLGAVVVSLVCGYVAFSEVRRSSRVRGISVRMTCPRTTAGLLHQVECSVSESLLMARALADV